MNDRRILDLYEQWSDELWCAGFMEPTEDRVAAFIDWLKHQTVNVSQILTTYENAMLAIYHRQTKTEASR